MAQSSNLFIDIGHSAIKWRMVDSDVNTQAIECFSIDSLPQCATVWLSHVAHQDCVEAIKQKFSSLVVIATPTEYKTLSVAYPIPSELGVDRFLAMLGAQVHHPNMNLLIIDIGSALTVDVVAETGKHQGGLIMPGLAALRTSFEKFATNSDLKGFSGLQNATKAAWLGGTESMLISSIKSQIDDFLDCYTNSKVILTGGGAKGIASAINENVEIYDNLVLDGIEYYAQTTS
ncbi:MAG: type III pantothenate kinase [Gammaproteobacteria bacterium]|nr:type III pantothenate kinase [Gammaproteobacteria bacterium]